MTDRKPNERRRRAAALAVRQRRQRRGKRPGGRGVGRRWLIAPVGLALLVLILTGTAAGVGYGVYRSFADDLVEPTAIELTQRALGTSKVFDDEGVAGELLFEFADPLSGLRNPIRIANVSPHLINATVATEDDTFFENRGVNLRGLARAAWENLGIGLGSGDFLGGSGGSSITQQLVKNVLIAPEERTEATIERKLKETILALELTEQYPKLQILEWYLNSIFYGNLSYGIGAASQRYFGKAAADLSLAEAALLAGLPQAPAIHDPFANPAGAKARQAVVLDLMVRAGYISQEEAETAKREPLAFASQAFEIQAPHFVLYVREEVERLCERGRFELPDSVSDCSEVMTQGGLRITTTLDSDLQRQAEQILRGDLATFEEQTGAHNAALVAIDPRSGEIRAMVGSRDFFRDDIDGQVNMVTALNSPGSSIKPITYAAAFVLDPKAWNPATIVWDVPLEFHELDGTVFSPENFDALSRGPVSIRTALANSINVPAFRVADAIGIENLLTFAHQIGLTTMADPANYGPSLTLGGGDVSLLDMAFAYSVFANNGVMRGQRTLLDLPFGFRDFDPIAVREIRDVNGALLYQIDGPEERQVMPAPQAFQITEILSDNQARSILYGLNSTLVLDRPSAAKTGTAGEPGRNDIRRDYWTVGYTPQLVTGVWVGNADNSPMTGGSSSRTAGLIWRDFMLSALHDTAPEAFVQPEGLTRSEAYIPQLRLLAPGQDRSAFSSQNPCGSVRIELFVAEGGVPEEDSGVCQRLTIDGRSFLLASEATPPEFAREGIFLLPLWDAALDEPDAEALAWLRTHKVRFVGDGEADEDAVFARIDSPVEGMSVGSGLILVRGRAAGEGVERWQLAFAAGEDPAAEDFIPLLTSEIPLQSGQLARWDTSSLAPGAYVLRLTVDHDFLGAFVVEVHVTVGKADPAAAGDDEASEPLPADPADESSPSDTP